jgi:hypothetical protein
MEFDDCPSEAHSVKTDNSQNASCKKKKEGNESPDFEIAQQICKPIPLAADRLLAYPFLWPFINTSPNLSFGTTPFLLAIPAYSYKNWQ